MGPWRQALARVGRTVVYHAGVRLGWRDPLVPPEWLHSVGPSDFVETGELFARLFRDVGGLRPGDRMLDVGSGTGRMARPLTRYLTEGHYDGLDVVGPSVAWCRRAYRRHPRFRFHHADNHNAVYNPQGSARASAYAFPFPDAAFDFVCLVSVFTHMLPADMSRYLSEIVRVLRPGGRCFITYFLLNAATRAAIDAGASRFTFRHPLDGCRVDVAEIPEAVVAYDEARVRAMYDERGLALDEPLHSGTWSGGKGLSFQEITVATKR